MAAKEVVIAIFLSILGVASLPRRSVRVRYAALGTRSRAQFWWFGGGSLILAMALWLDFALGIGDQSRISLFPVIVAGAGLWILMLAVSAIPDFRKGRSARRGEPGVNRSPLPRDEGPGATRDPNRHELP